MNSLKKILFVLVVALLFVGVGCQPKKPPKPVLEVSTVEEAVKNAFTTYSASEHGKFALTITNNNVVSKYEMTFNYEGGKVNVLSMSVKLENANGVITCFIEDGKAYMDRYGQSKTVVNVSEEEGLAIVEEYSFDAFTNQTKLLLGPSFFENITIDSFEEGLVKATLNLATYNISSKEVADENFEDIFNGVKEKKAVSAEINYTEEAGVSAIKVIMTNSSDEVSTIYLQFLGTSNSDINIEFPDFEEYK